MPMHTQLKQEPGPVTRARALGLTAREYSHLGEFSNNADKLGLKSVSVGKAPGLGCRLKLSGRHDYEVLLNNGIALLGRVEASGKRIKLHEGGTNVESTWNMLLKTIERDERNNG